MSNGCIHQLVYLRHGKWILGTSLIEVREIHAHSPLSCLLLYHHRIGQPLRIKNFFDSPSLLELGHLTSDSFGVLFWWAPRWLSFRNNGRIHIESMTDETWIYAWGFIWAPCEHIDIFFEELQQSLLLLRRQFSPNLEQSLRIISNTYPLQIFTLTSSAGPSKGNAGGFNCYNPLSAVAEVSASGRCCIAATRHRRAAT